MVLKRKLPSTMGESVASPAEQSDLAPEKQVEKEAQTKPESKENKAEVKSEKKASAAPVEEKSTEPQEVEKVPELDEAPAFDVPEEDVPLAPESAPEQDVEPDTEDMMIPVDDLSVEAPIAPPSFGEDALETAPVAPIAPQASPVEPAKSQGNGWSIEDLMPVAPQKEDLPEQPALSAQENDAKETPSMGHMPPWQQGGNMSEPPILPGADDEMDGSKRKAVVGLLLLIILATGTYYAFVERGDKTTERLARITNALEEVSEEPLEEAEVQPEKVQTTPVEVTDVKIEPVELEEDDPFLDFPAEGESLEAETELSESDVEVAIAEGQDKLENKTVVEFVDVSEEEADELITGEGAEEMPEEVTNFVDRWKNAVEQAEAKRQGKDEAEEAEEVAQKTASEEPMKTDKEKLDNLEDELAAYRRILAGDSDKGPKKVSPKEFFYGDGGKGMTANGNQRDMKTQDQAASMYGANPYNLPVVNEPSQKKLRSIRTLDDFDVTMFEPEKPRVRIPKNVHPTFKAHEFPQFYLLSLLPGQGVVAQNKGRQGVLMLGESVEGWELVAVASQYAEFRKGKRRHVLTLNGIQ